MQGKTSMDMAILRITEEFFPLEVRIISRKEGKCLGEHSSLSGHVDVPTGKAEASTFDEIAAHPEKLVDRQIGPFLVSALVGQGGSRHCLSREEPDTWPRICFEAVLSRSAGLCPGDFCDHRVRSSCT